MINQCKYYCQILWRRAC